MTTLKLVSVVVVSALMGLASCKSSEFTGSSGQIPAVERKEKPVDKKPITSEKKKPSTIEEPKESDKPEVEIEDETEDEAKDKPVVPGTGDNEDKTPKPSLIDIINGLKKILIPNDTVNDENRIVFGNAKGFHIGDDNFNSSSNCSTRLNFHNIKGTKYFFEFEVTKNDTKVELAINEVCGVDYADTNFASIEDAAGASLQKQAIPNNNAIKYQAVTLKAGKYKMVVESTPNTAKNGDRDDFMVKKLEIKSNKPIIAGKIGAL